MQRETKDLLAVLWIVLVLAAVIIVVATYGGTALETERRCLAAGYPQFKVTSYLERYCVRRVDQTDVVVSLAKAEAGR